MSVDEGELLCFGLAKNCGAFLEFLSPSAKPASLGEDVYSRGPDQPEAPIPPLPDGNPLSIWPKRICQYPGQLQCVCVTVIYLMQSSGPHT